MISQNSGIIYLHGLRVAAVIGIYEWEQRIRQTLVIDLEMGADIRAAAATDSIAQTLNYKAVAERVTAFVEATRFQLIETLAERIADILMGEFKIPWIKVSISKPGAIKGSRDVGVVIERGSRKPPSE
jgi:7,8-dihydroneopterin aldolase/epimerase/oxygenase